MTANDSMTSARAVRSMPLAAAAAAVGVLGGRL